MMPYTYEDKKGLAALALYVLSILAANWSIGHVGWCTPGGPCTIPVAPGLWAPSGVLWVGVALFARDLVQDTLGRRWTLAGILAGAALSYVVETPALAVASGAAFLVGEASDYLVYTPLREQHRHVLGVFASGVVGSLVDSGVFLQLAGFGMAFLLAQWVGKVEITALAALVVWLAGHRRHAHSALAPTSLASPLAPTLGD